MEDQVMGTLEWIKEELFQADFGDLRLNKRFKLLASELANKPSASINHASTDWAASKAAYRFFSNPKARKEQILSSHILSTQARAASYKRVLVLQDTSIINFNTHLKTTGLCRTSRNKSDESQGLRLHSSLMVTPKGLPLGLIDQEINSTTYNQEANSYKRKRKPIHKKASFKWFKALQAIETKAGEQEVILVCDREADIYELFEDCLDRGVDFVIRANTNRMLEEDELGDIGLFDRIGVEPVSAQTTVDVPSSGKRKARTAKLDVKYFPVTYAARPRGSGSKLYEKRSDLCLYVVHLHETRPPKGFDALSWTLVTSLPVANKTTALEVTGYYKLRWTVELYFKCLKTGCGVEKCRLNEAEKLSKFISLMSIIAWRILWMKFLNRHASTHPCDSFLTKEEWETLWFIKHKRLIKSGKLKAKPPSEPPSTYEAVRWIAMLGGFLGRKSDGEPGLITIWRGWKDLNAAVELYDVIGH